MNMEQFQMILDMVQNVTDGSLTVAIIYMVYMVLVEFLLPILTTGVVLYVVYGTGRLLIERLHSWLITPKDKLIQHKHMIGDICCLVDPDDVVHELRRIRSKTGTGSFHSHHLEWLRDAISEKKDREKKE